MRFGLVQGGDYFVTPVFATNNGWATHSGTLAVTGLCKVVNFSNLQSPAEDCSQNPNFSAGAGAMQFGYVKVNSFVAPGITVNYSGGVDNFTVAVNSAVPEPGTVALLGAGVAAMLGRRYFSQRASQSKSSE